MEPVGFRRECFSHSLSLLMSAFSLPVPPGGLTTRPSQAYGTLRYHACKHASSASAGGLSPGTSSAQAGLSRPVSYYAFFKGWLLLSQPPGCHGLPTRSEEHTSELQSLMRNSYAVFFLKK